MAVLTRAASKVGPLPERLAAIRDTLFRHPCQGCPIRRGRFVDAYGGPIAKERKEFGSAIVQAGMAKAATAERVADVDPGVLDRARGGDQRAFRSLVSHYDQRLRALAYRLLGDAGQMDDVLQDAYVKAYRGLAAFRGEAGVGTWLYRITYNACMDHLRRTGRVDHIALDGLAERASAEPDPGERAAARGSLADALAALSPEQRAVVMLVDAEGFDHAAAARVLGVAEGTVHSRLFRAHAILRARLGRPGGEG